MRTCRKGKDTWTQRNAARIEAAMALEGEFQLIQCDAGGQPLSPIGDLPPVLAENCAASAALYARIGFVPPWVSYIAVAQGVPVGGGAFVGAPREGRAEIAYFTLDGLEGRGFATKTARALVAIARKADPRVTLTAKTLPEDNASTAILRRLGFRHVGDVMDDDVGRAWEWHLPPG
jgi:ribosomal-protein-alanine N-acetyltransferase